MSTTADQRTPADLIRDLPIRLDANGKIIDVLNPDVRRNDTLEERVRQYYARVLIEEYNYPPDHIGLNCPIDIGSETKFADIVIYHSAEAATGRDQGQIHIIVETKAPNVQSGYGQLASYVFASAASGGVWFNGSSPAYYRHVTAPVASLQQWTNIPRSRELWESVGHYTKSDLRPPRELKQVFQRCHNIVYRMGMDSEDIALDMVKIILAKYRDEQNEGEFCEFRCTPEELNSEAGRRQSSNRVRALFSRVATDHPDVFSAADVISIGDENLSVIVSELQIFRFLSEDDSEQVYDVIGTAFEVYVSSHLKGARGQFFTNRLVVEMMVAAVNPNERDIIFDPACGSGGFLISALRFVRNRVMQSDRSPAAKHREVSLIRQRLFGTDISPRLVRVAKTNMILNGDGHGGIFRLNALQSMSAQQSDFPLDEQGAMRPTIVLANPPFGASHELRERSRDILSNFSLGHVWEQDEQGRLAQTSALNSNEGVPPETLFLERCIRMLQPGGRLAIVIARGILDNRDSVAARQYLLQECRLLAVINCHPNTFAPFNGTKACIIIAEKKSQPSAPWLDNYNVFMATSQSVGQDSQGREIYRTNDSGEIMRRDGLPILDHDLHDIGADFARFSRGESTEYEGAWTIPLARVLESSELRLNPTRYAPTADRALSQVLELADSDEWVVERLGDFAAVFNGPRFKRPFAIEGAVEGGQIVRMYTPKAFFEERSESVKLLDLQRANRTQIRQLEVLTIHRGYILIVDSGTAGRLLGRVGMATTEHDGSIANNNLIRIVIEDEARRAYVFQFLRSQLGQSLLLRNVYGTNQDHIEPDDVKNIPIPIPARTEALDQLSESVRNLLDLREQVRLVDSNVSSEFDHLFEQIEAAQDEEALG